MSLCHYRWSSAFNPTANIWDTNARSLADRAIGASLLNETGRHTLAYQNLLDSPVLRRATSFCTFAMFTCDIPPIPAWLYAMVFHCFNLTSLRPLETGTRAHKFKLGRVPCPICAWCTVVRLSSASILPSNVQVCEWVDSRQEVQDANHESKSM